MLLKKTRNNSKQINHSHKMELKRATSWNNHWNQFISKNFTSARPPQMTSIVQKKILERKAKIRLLLTATCSFSILGSAASIRWLKKMSLILLIVKQIWTKTAHRPQTNDSVRRRPPTNNSKCPWKCAIENLVEALIKENQTHVKNCYSQRLQ